MNAPKLPDISISDEPPIFIKPGVYEMIFVDYKTAYMFMGKAKKLVMTFRISSFGAAFGIELQRFYNISSLVGQPGHHGRFKASTKGAFLREYMTLFTGQVSRLDRIPMSLFEGQIIEGVVETVTRAQGRELPKELHYSVIRELRRIV